MANKPIHVRAKLETLQGASCCTRPGRELANMKAAEFEKCWIHDAFYLEYAQKEHDVFAGILRDAGAEVLYMEELLAEAMDVNPAARAAFLDEYMVQAPIPDPALVPLVREKLDAIENNRELVDKALAGMRVNELDLATRPAHVVPFGGRRPRIRRLRGVLDAVELFLPRSHCLHRHGSGAASHVPQSAQSRGALL